MTLKEIVKKINHQKSVDLVNKIMNEDWYINETRKSFVDLESLSNQLTRKVA